MKFNELTDEQKKLAKELGFSNMFCQPELEEFNAWYDHMITGIPPEYHLHVLTMVRAAVNTVTVEAAQKLED